MAIWRWAEVRKQLILQLRRITSCNRMGPGVCREQLLIPLIHNSLFISDIAIGPAGETYLGTNDSVYNSSSGRICQVHNEYGMAVDASGTLLTGTPTNQS